MAPSTRTTQHNIWPGILRYKVDLMALNEYDEQIPDDNDYGGSSDEDM